MSGEYVNGCELPSNFYKLNFKTQFNITDYLDQLDPIEVRAYGIAKKHLKSSFNLTRSNGYINWLNKKKEQEEKDKKEQEEKDEKEQEEQLQFEETKGP
jgi:hypothetical protein